MSMMDTIKCVLNFDQSSYKPGETVKCLVTLTFSEELTYRNISVRFLGESNTEFTKKKLSSNFKHRFAKHTGSQEHFRWYKDVISSTEEEGSIMQPGTYKYTINYTLPYGIPSTFHAKYGSVRYTAKVNIDKIFRDNDVTRKEFVVETPIDPHDIHLYADYLLPGKTENLVEFCCCGCRPSTLRIDTLTPAGRYETGQQIPLTVECRNIRNIHKFKLDIKLCKIVSFHSTLPLTEVKRDIEVLSRLTLSNKDKFDTKTWAGKLKVPYIEIPNLMKCAIIDVQFVIRMTACINGSLNDIKLNEIALLIEPGKPILNNDVDAKVAPIISQMEEFDSLLLYNGDESQCKIFHDTRRESENGYSGRVFWCRSKLYCRQRREALQNLSRRPNIFSRKSKVLPTQMLQPLSHTFCKQPQNVPHGKSELYSEILVF